MKRTHISLPSLQVAATAFLATTCRAEIYCIDKSTSEVVAVENCEGDVDNFATVEGPPDTVVGEVLAKRQDDEFLENLEYTTEFANRLIMMKLITGGFGADSCDCQASDDDDDESGRGGAVGGGAVGRPRPGRGG